MLCVAGVDIGAGSGAKIGLFARDGEMPARAFLPVSDYSDDIDQFCRRLALTVNAARETCPAAEVVAAGIACPGLFDADGGCMLCNNLPFLIGNSLPERLADCLGVPAWLINDAAAGGVAEWRACRRELAYWVIGGGWGGAWMGRDGVQRLPSMGWSGRIEDLRCINEPGFCIHIPVEELAAILEEHGLSWPAFLDEVSADAVHRDGEGAWLKASAVTSNCIALRHIFHLFARKLAARTSISSRGRRHVSADGRLFNRLADRGSEEALASGRFFVDVWAAAIDRFYRMAAQWGLTPAVPVHLGGGLVHPMERFLPRLRQRLRDRGIEPNITISLCHRQGKRANLLGAAGLAWDRLDAAASGTRRHSPSPAP